MQTFVKALMATASLLSLSAQAQTIETAELTIISNGTEEIALTGLAGRGLKVATSIQTNKNYVLISRYSRKCLDVVDHSREVGAEIQQWDCHYGDNQKFFLRSQYKFGNQLVPVESGISLGFTTTLSNDADSDQNGRRLLQSGLPYVNNFAFRPTSLAGVYLITTKSGASCLDIADWNPNNGARVQQWECHGGENQQWIVLEQR